MSSLPLILLGDAAQTRRFATAAQALGQPWLALADACAAPACRFALACDDTRVMTVARLNDRNCTGGLSARIVAQLDDPSSLGPMLGLPRQGAQTVLRSDSIGLLLTASRMQVIWRSESHDGVQFVSHADAARQLVDAALRTDWHHAKGFGRGLLHLTAIETPRGYGLMAARCGLPPDFTAVADALVPEAWRDLLAALLDDAPLCLTPPAPVIAVDGRGRIGLQDRLAA